MALSGDALDDAPTPVGWHDELGIAFRSACNSALSSMAAELLGVHLTTRRALGCALKWDCQLCRSPTP
jgi:hypothetical protein